MERVKNLTCRGKTILLIDLSHCPPQETIAVVEEAKKAVSRLAPKSGLVLTDVKGAHYNPEVAAAIKGLVSHNTPFVKASAVVGAEGAAAVLLQTVIFLTRRELKSFRTREEALEYLASVN